MATGDQADIVSRIRAVLPRGWFPDETPILDGLLNGVAAACAWTFGQILFVRQQARRLTASDVYLDMIAADFFDGTLTRELNESDAALSGRIGRELFREKGTRAGLVKGLTDLTGRKPWVFEPKYPFDTGGYRVGGVGYGAGGGYGSLLLPYQFFLIPYRPAGNGVAGVTGYVTTAGNAGALLSNGESTVAASTAVPTLPSGDAVQKCTLTGTSGVFGFVPAAQSNGQTYAIGVWVWIPAGSTITALAFAAEGNANVVPGPAVLLTATNAWQRIGSVHTATGTSTNLTIRGSASGSGAVLYVTAARIDATQTNLSAIGGYGGGAIEYVSADMIAGQVTDQMIYDEINDLRPASSIAWTAISN